MKKKSKAAAKTKKGKVKSTGGVKKRPVKIKARKTVKKVSATSPGKKRTGLKCCKHCQDFKYCKDKNGCCEYCDHYNKGKCTYKEDNKRALKIEAEFNKLADYRGDEYGIDEYEAYSEEFE